MLALRTAVRKVERLAYSPDGTRLAANGVGGTEVFDLGSQESLALLDWSLCKSIAFCLDSNFLFEVSRSSGIRLTKLSTPQGVVLNQSGDAYICYRWIPTLDSWIWCDGSGVRRPYLLWYIGGTVRRPTPGQLILWSYSFDPDLARSRGVAIFGDPLRVAVLASIHPPEGQPTQYLYLLDGDTGELIRRHRCGYGSVEHFTGSPCGGYLVGVRQATLIVWDTSALHLPPQRWANDSRKQFTGVAFHPHGRYLLTASNDKSVKLWDLTCGQVVRSYDWSAGRMRSVAVAPDGLTAAAGSDENLVVLFDLDL